MIAVDSNVLIAAHRLEHPIHKTAMNRLREIAEGASPWGLPVFCITEFLRVVTHPSVLTPPTSLKTALSFVSRLIESPTGRLLFPGDRFWDLLQTAAVQGDARGNLIFDAQIAALCLEHGALNFVTADRDFARFSDLRPEFL